MTREQMARPADRFLPLLAVIQASINRQPRALFSTLTRPIVFFRQQ